ncbi:NAD(P)H-dependent oxidoreductase [Alteromonas sp. ASW11-36]|uniref:NAD(P)H-dependent oxidoreductase n=1 Tax=Alteromonas arenosi TaxID=3055817 RepID=A0ABT7SY78_9ALTE|nr:NAD(P)H-dependent oxidoreductase [Alteromonas sp. ASW11-36]MDM7861145.1 NAD(P)H-dependent oxidoreductase [Alteromonas sp. ASW11-36]
MKILALAASNSRKSINKALVAYATSLLGHHSIDVIDINDYDMPIYSNDLEEAHGIPDAAYGFLNRVANVDALLISYAEHNGNYTAAFKNLLDWASRINAKVYQGKSIVMLSTSPGPGGANSVLSLARDSAQYFDGNVVATLSIPYFYDNFDLENGRLSNTELVSELQAALATLDCI